MSSNSERFGQFRYDPVAEVLYRGDEPVPLGRRAQRLLAALLRQRGRVLTKSELIDAAWPDEDVEESNLSVQLSHLRRVIGGEWIRTIERVGYRFLTVPSPREDRVVTHIGLPALAVLPFADLTDSGGPSQLAAGLVEDLTTALTRFKSLLIVARTSSSRRGRSSEDVRSIAGALGARYVVEGSVRRVGHRLKTTAQLVDGITGTQLWARTFDSGSAEPIIEALAAGIETEVHAAEIKRSRRDRPESQEAYDLYLRARLKILSSRADDNAAAITLYTRALELEPDNTLYLSGAAEARQHRTAVGWAPLTADDRRATRELGQRVLDRPDADAVSLGLVGNAFVISDEEDLGVVTTERAAQMNRNSPLALVCDGMSHLFAGSIDQAELQFTRSVHLNLDDPNQRFALGGLATVYGIREDYEQSLRVARRACAMNQGFSFIHWSLVTASVHLGRMDDARRYLERYRAIAPEATIDRIRRGQPYADAGRIAPMLAALRLAGMP